MTKNRQHDLIIDAAYCKEILRLSDFDAGALLKALIRFCETGHKDFNDSVTAASVMFNLICNDIEAEQAKWCAAPSRRTGMTCGTENQAD